MDADERGFGEGLEQRDAKERGERFKFKCRFKGAAEGVGFVPTFAFSWLNSIQILALLQSIPSLFRITREYPVLTVSLTLSLTVCMAVRG